jgi:hypothetical protein
MVSGISGNRKQNHLKAQSHDQTFFHQHSTEHPTQQGFHGDQPGQSGDRFCRLHPV